MKYVPDTSVIINGKFCSLVEENRGEIIIPEAVVSEIEAQADRGLLIGFTGLKELEKLKNLEKEGKVTIEFYGKRPEKWQIDKAKSGEIDEIIRNVAFENDATLVTSDYVQSMVAKVKGLDVIYIESKKEPAMKIEDFFDSETMSVHLKENTNPLAKKGSPGNFKLVKISEEKLSDFELEEISTDIIERARSDKNSFIEMELKGATVVQLREFRIVITREPFSDGIEITAVRPLVKFSIDHYNMDEKLLKRLNEKSNGIIISGSPGAGKTTFAQALAEMYVSNGKIVKTMEKPRDLQVSDEITQYSALEGQMEKTGNILLLVRPDITIFDEVRTTDDFKTYADLRLSGVGMVGVVHATRAVDAIQRLIGRIELGVIPQVVDTVIHIDSGKVSKVLILEYVVKVPSGLKEEDLSRPVIEVRDFFTGNIEYEIYSFGEQIVVVPVKREKSKIYDYAEMKIEDLLKKYIHGNFRIEIVSEGSINLFVPEESIPEIIGKGGSSIDEIEKKIGMHIEVYPFRSKKQDKIVKLIVEKKKDNFYLISNEGIGGKSGTVYANDRPLFSAIFSKEGIIKIKMRSDHGQDIMDAIKNNEEINFRY